MADIKKIKLGDTTYDIRDDRAADILDVVKLPETGDSRMLYRLTKGTLVEKQLRRTDCFCTVVETLPTPAGDYPAESIISAEDAQLILQGQTPTIFNVYYIVGDKAYCYIPAALGQAFGLPADWYDLTLIKNFVPALTYLGTITDIAENDAENGTFNILIEYPLYWYKDGVWNTFEQVEMIGEGPSAIKFNHILNIASGTASTAFGIQTKATGSRSFTEGHLTEASGMDSHAEGQNTLAKGDYAHAEGFGTTASGESSHAEGRSAAAKGDHSHAEGDATRTEGFAAHAEGSGTVATGPASHAEGYNASASGEVAHAEGFNSEAVGNYSHAEGNSTEASGQSAHAEGYHVSAAGFGSHAEGGATTAYGEYAHSEGLETQATGDYSHAAGFGTVAANTAETVVGMYNTTIIDSLFTVGNGNEAHHSNAFVVHYDGRASVGKNPVSDLDVATKKYADDKFSQSNELIEDLKSFVDYENGIYKDGGDFLNPEMISAYNQGKSAIAILQDRINNKPIKFVGVMPNCYYMFANLNTDHLELWENISLHGIYNPDNTITDFSITNTPDDYSIKNCSAQTSGFSFEEDLTPGSNYFKITLFITVTITGLRDSGEEFTETQGLDLRFYNNPYEDSFDGLYLYDLKYVIKPPSEWDFVIDKYSKLPDISNMYGNVLVTCEIPGQSYATISVPESVKRIRIDIPGTDDWLLGSVIGHDQCVLEGTGHLGHSCSISGFKEVRNVYASNGSINNCKFVYNCGALDFYNCDYVELATFYSTGSNEGQDGTITKCKHVCHVNYDRTDSLIISDCDIVENVMGAGVENPDWLNPLTIRNAKSVDVVSGFSDVTYENCQYVNPQTCQGYVTQKGAEGKVQLLTSDASFKAIDVGYKSLFTQHGAEDSSTLSGYVCIHTPYSCIADVYIEDVISIEPQVYFARLRCFQPQHWHSTLFRAGNFKIYCENTNAFENCKWYIPFSITGGETDYINVYVKGVGDLQNDQITGEWIPAENVNIDTLELVTDEYVTQSELSSLSEVVNSKADLNKGDGEKSVEQKDSTAISQYAVALGETTVAGLKGFPITGYDDTNQTYTVDSIMDTALVGATYSIQLGSNYDDIGIITNIEIVDGKSIISVDNYITGNGLAADAERNIWFPDFPEVGTVDLGIGAFAEGGSSRATHVYAHAEGRETKAIGKYAHTEGRETIAHYAAHAEGRYTKATGEGAHSEGNLTTASGKHSHAEGKNSQALAEGSHAEGYQTTSTGEYSHAEGQHTASEGKSAHAEGGSSTASGEYSHAEGYNTAANGNYAHTEGANTTASQNASHAEGFDTNADGIGAHAEGRGTSAIKDNAHAEGLSTTASAVAAHAEGNLTTASGTYSHAEGSETLASNSFTHAEGVKTKAQATAAHAEGNGTVASGASAHAEGQGPIASGQASHAEGINATTASGKGSHAEGTNTKAQGDYSHSEGWGTKTGLTQSDGTLGPAGTGTGIAAHAEGQNTQARADYSHAGGQGTITTRVAQTAIGLYNKTNDDALFVIGNGTGSSTTARANAFEVLADGRAIIGKAPENDMDVANRKFVEDQVAANSFDTNGWDFTTNGALLRFGADTITKIDGEVGKVSIATGEESLCTELTKQSLTIQDSSMSWTGSGPQAQLTKSSLTIGDRISTGLTSTASGRYSGTIFKNSLAFRDNWGIESGDEDFSETVYDQNGIHRRGSLDPVTDFMLPAASGGTYTLATIEDVEEAKRNFYTKAEVDALISEAVARAVNEALTFKNLNN